MVATATPTQVLTFTRSINAPLEQVWQSFVSRDDICDWLCYNALLDAREDGHIFLTWYEGQHAQRFASGIFRVVEENAKLAFTWNDAHYDGQTKVKVLFEESDGAVTVTVHHKGFADSTPIETIEHYQSFWDYHLDELKSILETGARKNIVDRVILGFFPTEFNEEIAKDLGVPVTDGVRVAAPVPDYSVEAAGIVSDDVIVEVDGLAVGANAAVLADVTGKYKPGDELGVVYYHGAEKHTATVSLKGYPVPPIPADFKEMVEQHKERYASLKAQLDEVLKGVSEEAAEQRLGETQYSIKETLAYLILQQRHSLQYLASYAQGPRIIASFTSNLPWIKSIVKAFGTVEALREELRRVQKETIKLIAHNFSDDLLARKNYIWWMTFELHSTPILYNQQIEHVKRTLATVSA